MVDEVAEGDRGGATFAEAPEEKEEEALILYDCSWPQSDHSAANSGCSLSGSKLASLFDSKWKILRKLSETGCVYGSAAEDCGSHYSAIVC